MESVESAKSVFAVLISRDAWPPSGCLASGGRSPRRRRPESEPRRHLLKYDLPALAYGYAVAGQRADAKRLIENLVRSDRSRYLPPFHIALAYAGLGDKDAALRWLERAYTEHASFMDGIEVTPAFDVLHSDPRFAALLERMNF